MKFEYVLPAETIVKRTFSHDRMQDDLYDLLIDGATVATMDYETARAYWMGRTTIAAILAGEVVIADSAGENDNI